MQDLFQCCAGSNQQEEQILLPSSVMQLLLKFGYYFDAAVAAAQYASFAAAVVWWYNDVMYTTCHLFCIALLFDPCICLCYQALPHQTIVQSLLMHASHLFS